MLDKGVGWHGAQVKTNIHVAILFIAWWCCNGRLVVAVAVAVEVVVLHFPCWSTVFVINRKTYDINPLSHTTSFY